MSFLHSLHRCTSPTPAMASITHTDEKGIPEGNMSAESTRAPSEFKDEQKPIDDEAQEADDGKITSSSAANEQDDDIVYPEGITFILILVSLLLCTFLTALDQVWRLVTTVVITSTFLIRERLSWLQPFRRSPTSSIASMMCLGMALPISSPWAVFSRRGGKPTSTFLSSTPFSFPLSFSNSEV